MTIYLYSGTPGSGKSLHATMDIWDAIDRRNPLPVVANYRISKDVRNADSVTYVNNFDLTPEFLIEYATKYWHTSGKRFKEDHILLVIDEAQIIYNSRSWQQKDRMTKTEGGKRKIGWIEFFSQHRKYGYKIIFIAQFDRMIDRQIRSLFEYECIHRKLGNFGRAGKIMALVGGKGGLFCYVTTFYSMKERLQSNFFRVSKKILRMYDSYGTFEGK